MHFHQLIGRNAVKWFYRLCEHNDESSECQVDKNKCGISYKEMNQTITGKKEMVTDFFNKVSYIHCDTANELYLFYILIGSIGGLILLSAIVTYFAVRAHKRGAPTLRSPEQENQQRRQENIELNPTEDNIYDELYYMDGRQLDQAARGRPRYSQNNNYIWSSLKCYSTRHYSFSSRRGRGTASGGRQLQRGSQGQSMRYS